MTVEDLKIRYNIIVSKYTDKFCEKHGLYLRFWVAEVGDVACFGDLFFDFRNIKYDIDTNQPKGLIIEWMDYACKTQNYISFECYSKKPISVI